MHSHAQGRRAPSEQQTPSGAITLNALVHRWLWPVLSLCVLTVLRHPAQAQEMGAGRETCVGTVHSFTARMCAASRWEETQRPDSLFVEPQAYTLAGSEGRASPM